MADDFSNMERYGFFDANEQYEDGSYDIEYSQEDFAKLFKKFIGNGVFVDPADQLKVRAAGGLKVSVQRGWAYIDGYYYELEQDVEIQFDANATPNTIKNVVVVTLNKSSKKIYLSKKQDVVSIKPLDNGSVHELVLCDFSLKAGAGQITDSMITDRRPDRTYCGYVTGLVSQIDFSSMFLQVTDAAEQWLEGIKGRLTEDPATSLQNQIDTIKEETVKRVEDLNDVTIGRYVDSIVVDAINKKIDGLKSKLYPNSRFKVVRTGTEIYSVSNADYVKIYDIPSGKQASAIVTNGDFYANGCIITGTYIWQGKLYAQLDRKINGQIRLNVVLFLI